MKAFFQITALGTLLGLASLAGQASSGSSLEVTQPSGPNIVGNEFIGTVWVGEDFDYQDLKDYTFTGGALSIELPGGELVVVGDDTEEENSYLGETITISANVNALAHPADRFFEDYGEAMTTLTAFEPDLTQGFWSALVWVYGNQLPEENNLLQRFDVLLPFYRGYFATTDDFPGGATEEMVFGMLELYQEYLDVLAEEREETETITWTLLEGPEGLEIRKLDNNRISFKGRINEPGTYKIRLKVEQGDISAERNLTLEVLPTELVMQYVSEEFTVDVGEHLQGIFYLSGRADEDYNFSLTYEGELPEGVEFEYWEVDEFGQKFIFIRGVPESTGEYPLVLVAKNRRNEQRMEFVVRVVEPEAETEKTKTPETDEPDSNTEDKGAVEESEPDLELASTAFGADYEEYSPGFSYSSWFGFAYVGSMPWVYNFELGWMYIYEGTTSDEEVWFYHAGNPSRGWMFSGSGLDGFFYYELSPGEWDWQWLYTGAVDMSTPENPPANP